MRSSTFSEPFTRDIIAAAQSTTKPVFVVWGAPAGTDDTYYKRLLDGGLPVFRTFHNCVAAVKSYADYWSFAQRYRRRSPTRRRVELPAARKARKLLADAEVGRGAVGVELQAADSRAYGIKTSKDELCGSAAEAVRAAKAIGFPVVMKVSSPDLLHKTDVGVVKVGVGSAAEVRAAYDELLRKAKKADRRRPHRGRDGVRDGDRRRRHADRRVDRRPLRTGRHDRCRAASSSRCSAT